MDSQLAERSHYIMNILDHYFPSPPTPLNNHNDFTFAVAVVLSAQTTDGKVNEVTKVLFDRAATPEEMSKLDPTEVQSIIQPVGLAQSKAKYIVGLSKKLFEEFNSKIPNTLEQLQSLPGVGRKTASVIMSQIFGIPAFAVDTHVHRLANRWNLSKEKTNPDKVQKDLCSIFPESCWNKLHLQMIYFGREFCTAKDHEINDCPICCFVNKKPMIPPTDLSSFKSKKKAKGIVYYDDRITQLNHEPQLAYHSPFSPSKTKTNDKIIDEQKISVVEELHNTSSDIFDAINSETQPHGATSKKRKQR
eukprot:gene11960-16008_t